MVSALVAGLGLLPFAGVLVKHLAKEPAYTIPLVRSLLYIGVGVTVPLLAAVLGQTIWHRRGRADIACAVGPSSLGGFALAAALCFLSIFLAVRGLTGMNLVNTGVALVPASWLVFAAAFWLSTLRRSLYVSLFVGALACNCALTAKLLHDPSILTGNRLSTITKFKRLVDEHPHWANPSLRRAIIHIDWPRDNAHFRSAVSAPSGLAGIVYVSTGNLASVHVEAERLAAGGADEILLITRGKLAPQVLRELDGEFSIGHLSRGVAIATKRGGLGLLP